jgi:hypothetical protein
MDADGCSARIRHARRGQFEMIGLVFVVLIIVVGIVLYMLLGSNRPLPAAKGGSSFLVALTETTVPACDASVEELARACVKQESLCDDPCFAAQEAFETIGSASLGKAGYRYNLSIEGTAVMVVEGDCVSADPRIALREAPRQTIAGLTANVRLSVCG